MCEHVCRGTCLSKYHQQKQKEMGWKQFKRIFCNSLGLFPLASIRLSYLIYNGFHLVAFIPQGSSNIQFPPFFPHNSFLILTGYKCFITNRLKKSERDDYQDPRANHRHFLDKTNGAQEWKCGSNGLSNEPKEIEPKRVQYHQDSRENSNEMLELIWGLWHWQSWKQYEAQKVNLFGEC